MSIETNEEFRPKIVAFCCNWCSYAGADLAGSSRLSYPADVKIIRVPCSCRVNPLFILRAFQKGADGVILCGCHPGGDLTDDLKDNINYGRTTTVVKEEKEEPSNLLLDLTDEAKAPEISNVTMGDAEEYFEDLGLEYNKDYIDSSKTTRVEKNANLDQERKAIPVTDGQNSSTILIKDEKNENEVETNKDKEEKPDDSNLFDLIDSMYEE